MAPVTRAQRKSDAKFAPEPAPSLRRSERKRKALASYSDDVIADTLESKRVKTEKAVKRKPKIEGTVKPRPRPLASVVGFTDASGRTSTATTETEHYRLRGVGLNQLQRSCTVERVALYDHVTDEIEKIARLQSPLLVKDLCTAVTQKLPRELRDIVYKHVKYFDFRLEAHCQPGSTYCRQLDEPRTKHWRFGYLHWSLDPTITCEAFSREMCETTYRSVRFELNTDLFIGRVLDEDLFQCGIDPKQLIADMEIILAESY